MVSKGRPNQVDVLLDIAKVISRRSTCPKLATATVLATDDGTILSTGYNGAPRHMEECGDVGCTEEGGHCVRSVHGEVNAVVNAARLGVSTVGSRAYVTHLPCIRCVNMLIQAGVVSIVYRSSYADELMLGPVSDACRRAGVLLGKRRKPR